MSFAPIIKPIITPIILSGGSGTRLWPLSRTKLPKQFCELFDKPLQTMTIERLQKYGDGLLVTSERLKDLTEKDIIEHKLKLKKVLYEPEGKNTAPAIALALKYLSLEGKVDQLVGIFPSDSLITNTTRFEKALKTAINAADQDYVVTLGIRPHSAETGFGYIQVKERAVDTDTATEVLKFHEKPNFEQAQKFLQEGCFFWNAGIFIFKVSVMIAHFKKHEPQIWKIIDELKPDLSNLKAVYGQVKSISVDYAIIEKLQAQDLRCVPCDIGWSDVGSWDAMVEVSEALPFTESSLKKQPVQVTAKNNNVFSKLKKKYAFVGCEDLIVVDTADATLICEKGSSQKVKDVVEALKIKDQNLTEDHVFENRPWGMFEVLTEKDYFKSKIIRVEPGQRLSYQSHDRRSEHWIVVKGELTVILDDKEIIVKQGEHIFIPKGTKHRAINYGSVASEFIEVQVGSYFGEDDIVRYQDEYGRN